MPQPYSAALPIAHILLRILIILNWLLGAAIITLLLVMPNERWIMASFHLAPSPDADRLVMGLRAVAVIGVIATPLNWLLLTRLRAIVATVRTGDPFVAANAQRLQGIAWVLLALQCLGIVVGAINRGISTPAHPVHLNASASSLSGWLAILLAFVLARVFAEGARMRDDLAGTV
jgi:hypothetical protein